MIFTSDFLMSDSEKLYYITSSVDSTKYYKRGKSPKSLIKAKNKSEAEKFTLLEAMDCTNGKKEYMYSIIPVEDDTSEIEQEVIDEDNNIDLYDNNSIIDYNESNIFNNINWEELLLNLKDISDNIDTYEKNVKETMSNIDKEICDIMHYLEFKDLDDNDKIKVATMLQERRRYRRKVKDEYEKILIARSTFLNNSFKNKIKQFCTDVESMNYRHYTPRKLNELFDSESITM